MTLRRSLLLSALLALPLGAQVARTPADAGQLTQNEIGYPVTGRVICGDTQRPARFAQVTLMPAVTGQGGGRRVNAHTDLDGHFTLSSVPPGDYFVTADLPGYVNESAAVQDALNTNTSDSLRSIAAVPRISVTAGGGTAQVSLQRGAVLAGQITWDDGTPAAGVAVSAQHASSTNALNSEERRGGFGPARSNQTDDQGRFRISGLAPGSYNLRASVQSPLPSSGDRFQRMQSLNIYAPGKFRASEAGTFALSTGEERDDVTLVLALDKLHVVSGQVGASSGSVRSGSVTLTDQQDGSLTRRGTIASDGRFTIPYVPAGSYTLRVQGSAQASGAPRGTDTTGFAPAQLSLTVSDSDLTGVAVTVTPPSTTP